MALKKLTKEVGPHLAYVVLHRFSEKMIFERQGGDENRRRVSTG